MINKNIYSLDFETSFGQFYLIDKESPMKIGALDDFWNEIAHENRLAVSEGVLGIGIQSYGCVKGEIVFYNEAPLINEVEWDHVVEGSINIKTGILRILNCPYGEIIFEKEIPPENYRVRVSGKNFESVLDDCGNDFYRIEIWATEVSEHKLIKLYLR